MFDFKTADWAQDIVVVGDGNDKRNRKREGY